MFEENFTSITGWSVPTAVNYFGLETSGTNNAPLGPYGKSNSMLRFTTNGANSIATTKTLDNTISLENKNVEFWVYPNNMGKSASMNITLKNGSNTNIISLTASNTNTAGSTTPTYPRKLTITGNASDIITNTATEDALKGMIIPQKWNNVKFEVGINKMNVYVNGILVADNVTIATTNNPANSIYLYGYKYNGDYFYSNISIKENVATKGDVFTDNFDNLDNWQPLVANPVDITNWTVASSTDLDSSVPNKNLVYSSGGGSPVVGSLTYSMNNFAMPYPIAKDMTVEMRVKPVYGGSASYVRFTLNTATGSNVYFEMRRMNWTEHRVSYPGVTYDKGPLENFENQWNDVKFVIRLDINGKAKSDIYLNGKLIVRDVAFSIPTGMTEQPKFYGLSNIQLNQSKWSMDTYCDYIKVTVPEFSISNLDLSTNVENSSLNVMLSTKNQSEADMPVTMIAGLYEWATNKLVAIKLFPYTARKNVEESISSTLTTNRSFLNNNDYIVKVFFMSGDGNLSPVVKPISSTSIGLALPNFFTENMVLQRDKVHTIWGTGVPKSAVNVTLSNANNVSTATATVDPNGNWKVDLTPLPYGTDYKLNVRNINDVKFINNISIGDVFVLAGQSNMAQTYNMAVNYNRLSPTLFAPLSTNPMIRYLAIRTIESTTPTFDAPLSDTSNPWHTLSADNNKDLSLIGEYFADELLKINPNVPVGLISTPWGGTGIDRWMRLSDDNKTPNYTPTDGKIFNNHIAPITNYKIGGILWYQGENDSGTPISYKESFPRLIDDYRNLWNEPTLPFLYVQLARFSGFEPLRETQRLALDNVAQKSNVGMVVILDTDKGSSSNIHPYGKEIVGYRMSLLARKMIFNENIVATGPLFSQATISGNKIIVEFKAGSIGSGLKINDVYNLNSGGTLKEFEIAGSDGIFTSATAVINNTNNTVEVSSATIAQPMYVRYAYSAVPANPNLFNNEGLPASPFTTQN